MIENEYQKCDRIMNPAQYLAFSTSIDELAEKTGFDLNFCQLEKGEPILKSSTTILPSVITTAFYFNKAFHQEGTAPEGYMSFGLMLDRSELRCAGKNYNANHLFDFNGLSGFEAVSNNSFTAKTLHVNVDRLLHTADLHEIELTALGKADYPMPMHIDPINLQQLHAAIYTIEKSVCIMPQLLQGNATFAEIEDTAYRNLADCLSSSQRDETISLTNRRAVLRRSIEFIRTHYGEIITVTDICRVCATTSRTLERVFHEEFGIAPKQYLTKIRLSKARESLCLKDQEMNITEIAFSSGFSHMGQFSQDYKKHFGELPSQTSQCQHYTPNHR
jgi:AraC family ethanolamine operon transcriptional activator